MSVTKAEVLFTGVIVEHNLPIRVSEHTLTLFRKMFPGSKNSRKILMFKDKNFTYYQ